MPWVGKFVERVTAFPRLEASRRPESLLEFLCEYFRMVAIREPPRFSRLTRCWAVSVKLTCRCFNASGAHAGSHRRRQVGRPSRPPRNRSRPCATRRGLPRRANLQDREAGARFPFLQEDRAGSGCHGASIAEGFFA